MLTDLIHRHGDTKRFNFHLNENLSFSLNLNTEDALMEKIVLELSKEEVVKVLQWLRTESIFQKETRETKYFLNAVPSFSHREEKNTSSLTDDYICISITDTGDSIKYCYTYSAKGAASLQPAKDYFYYIENGYRTLRQLQEGGHQYRDSIYSRTEHYLHEYFDIQLKYIPSHGTYLELMPSRNNAFTSVFWKELVEGTLVKIGLSRSLQGKKQA